MEGFAIFSDVETHALGLPFYELTSLVLKFGKDEYHKQVHEKINYYCQRLIYWQENIDKLDFEWASFLMDDNRPNKEKLLSKKKDMRRLSYNCQEQVSASF